MPWEFDIHESITTELDLKREHANAFLVVHPKSSRGSAGWMSLHPEDFSSMEGKTRHQLWMDLCDLVVPSALVHQFWGKGALNCQTALPVGLFQVLERRMDWPSWLQHAAKA